MRKEEDVQKNIENYNRYAKIRDKRKYTDYKVAKKMGTGNAMFTHWKQGKYTPKPDKLQKIAEVLNVSLNYLMGLSDVELPLADTPYYKSAEKLSKGGNEAATRLLQQAIIREVNPSEDECELILAYRNAEEHIKQSILTLLQIDVRKKEETA